MNEKFNSHIENMRDLESLYRSRWLRHGLSPQSLGWTKGKQDIRFDIILSDLSCEGKSFLDVGCGFGDLNLALFERARSYKYLGLDIVSEFINEGRVLYGSDLITFQEGDFFSSEFNHTFDYIVASGIFAFELKDINNYEYIEAMLKKMFDLSTEAVSVDFLSSFVNFKRPQTFYADPSVILDMALKLTRNVILRHDYMPFEFSIKLFKNDSFQDEDTVFERYKNAR